MTEFVMVPVPEDLVERVATFAMMLDARKDRGQWTDDEVRVCYADADPACRALLRVAARAITDGEAPDEEDVAERTGLSVRETAGILRELVDHAGTRHIPILASAPSDDDPGRRTMRMTRSHARAILDAASSDESPA